MTKAEGAPKPAPARKRVLVLFSGRGSNMSSLISASMAPDYPAIITRVVTNVPDAGGLEIAAFHDIPADVIDHRAYMTRQDHEAALMEIIAAEKPDLICLAGYMRILSDQFTQKFRGKILNIHPSLLPSFKGVDTHHRALVAGVKIHGATVHFVDETLDGGQIIAQAAVPVAAGDDDDSLAAKVLEAEHRLYPHALALVASGAVRLSGSRIVVSNSGKSGFGGTLFSPSIDPQKYKR